MSNKFTSTIQTYNQLASQFSQHFEKKLDTTELNKFLDSIPKGGAILDAGCGSARDSAYFISKGCKALGIDLSEGLLTEAKRLHPEVPTMLMSLTDISLPDREFDGIWCKASLLHIDRSEVPSVLKSFFRILKPGGTLFIQTKAGEGEGTQPAQFDKSVTRLFTFFSIEELESLAKQAGFNLVHSYEFNGKDRSSSSRDQRWIVLFTEK